MARKSYLIQRGGRWFYNRAYPKALWPTLGKAPFRKALGTDSLEVAQRLRSDADRLFWATVDAARKEVAELRPRTLAETEVIALVSRWFRERDADWAEHQQGLSLGGYDSDAELAQIETQISDAAQAIGENDLAEAKADAVKLLEREGIKAERQSPSYRALLQLLLRARKELALQAKARLLGDYGRTPADPVIARALSDPAAPQKRTIADLIKAYEADKSGGWSPATKIAYAPVWRLLKDTLGTNRDVATLTREDGRTLLETVKGLPRGLGKIAALKGLSVPEAVAKARELELPTISAKTISGTYLNFLKTAFAWAVDEQWIAASPVARLNVVDTVDAADKRDPFTTPQLKTIFGAAPWSPRDDSPGDKPLHFWGPLLALFLGMRRGEITQLNVADVEDVDGVPVVLVRPGMDGQRVKTKAGRRMLPVHDELKRMGFLAFVEKQRKDGQSQLFPGEVPNANGQWGDGLSDWFLRQIKPHGLMGRRLGMHSFRHNFEDRLRAAELHGTPIGRELAGRSKGKDSVAGGYGSGYSAKQLADAVAKISYPGLDLSHLHVAQPHPES